MRAIFVGVLFMCTLVVAQLINVQGVNAAKVSQEATNTRVAGSTIAAPRGRFLDRNGQELAGNITRMNVVADPWTIRQHKGWDSAKKKRSGPVVGPRGAAEELAPVLKLDVDELERKLTHQPKPEGTPDAEQDRYRLIATKVTPTLMRSVRQLDIPGITGETVPLRSYAAGRATGPLLGRVGPGGRAEPGGGLGLEARYDDVLTGTPGSQRRERSGDGRTIPLGDNVVNPAIPGRDVKLTIDKDLSWVAYNAIGRRVREMKALNGTAVVMDRQGRLLAMAQYPSYDPDKILAGEPIQNFAVENVFEPGSTAKVMSIGAALAEGVVQPTTAFTVPDNIKRPGVRVLKDSHPHPTQRLTTAGILAQSSNVGTILIAEQLDRQTLESYYRAFGVGAKTGINLAGESPGLLRPSKDWDVAQRLTVMYGQGMAMTALQTASVMQTVANGGVRIPPSIVAGIAGEDGTFQDEPLPQGTRVLPEKTAAELTVMLEAVVGDSGTAAGAVIPGYRVAGKTGTAQRYSGGGYTASFVGFAPAEKPEYIIAVTVERPLGAYYGGIVVAPVFKEIMAYALESGGIKPAARLPRLYPLEVGKPAPTVPWAQASQTAKQTR